MAGKKAPSRSSSSARRTGRPSPKGAAKSRSRWRIWVWAAVRWIVAVSRPRRPSEVLALLFVLLALGTFVAQQVAWVTRGSQPDSGFFWCVALLLLALAARLSPWWRSELQTMTRERARHYVGSGLLVFVALSFSWHIFSESVGLGDYYLLLGPFSSAEAGTFVLIFLVLTALAVLAGLPVGRWRTALYSSTSQAIDGWRRRDTISTVDVQSLPQFEPVAPPSADELPSEPEIQPAPQSRPEEAKPVNSVTPHRPMLPPIDIFDAGPKGPSAPLDIQVNAQRIQETLASFNVSARVVGHHAGPVVTQFDVQPDRGVKVRRITELQNDLALALAAPTIRIQAPVPGKPVVGIEIPNTSATMVALRDLIESEQYTDLPTPLKVGLGKDVAGKPAVIDLAKMPHLLIAGATGSGKSVCVNSIISCLLYQNTPDQVRLMLVDPKMVELTVYNGVPHLLSPVVTQMDKVVGVLQWAIREMERRYQLFADNTVRNILRYNEKMEAAGAKKLPYIVLVVDELADLMMVSPDEVEDAICRLAQLARAAGIHLVIATQRPSVDVITGLIKANFPARIAFAMTSQVDSRTILDTVGAEKLLGRGDMLYQPPDAPKPVRLQGAFLSDQEIERLVDFWRAHPLGASVPQVSEDEFAAAERASRDVTDDLLDEATRVVREYQHASVSLLQRRLKVGYARAARLMDQLEAGGIVGPADGSKQRPVLDEGFGDEP